MKSKNSKRLLSLVLSLAMVFSVIGVHLPVYAETSPVQITIFHTNDMHGRLLDAFNTASPPALTQIGADYIAAIKQSVPGALLIDAGDATQGLPFASLSKGADVIKLMNAAGYDGMALGNHEFDYGKDQVLINAKLANFPVVSANTLENGQPILKDVNGNNGTNFIKTVNGVKVGFFGITTEETLYKTNPANLPGVTFADPIQTSKTEVSKLKAQGAQVIVGIMHIGNDSSSEIISEDIANAVNGINVIIDGHSHSVENKVVNNTLIAQTSCYNANVGRLDITVDSNGNITFAESLIKAANVASAYTPVKAVQDLAKQINDSQKPIFEAVVGRTDTPLWGGTVNGLSIGRLTETNMGDLVADAMVYGAKSQVKGTSFEGLPVVSLENGGGVRDSIPAGSITQGQVITVLPFGNILSLKEVTPDILYKVLENGVSKVTQDPVTGIIKTADGRFPQISGMRFEYNPANTPSNTDATKPPLVTGNRVTKIVLLNEDGTDKKVLDRNDSTTRIVLASNDFEIGGGDGYTMLAALKNIGEGNALDVIAAQYITKLTEEGGGSFSYPAAKGRTKVVNDHEFQAYQASITVKNGVDPAKDTLFTYRVDNGTKGTATTDSNGVLKIEGLAAGPHTINISKDGYAVDVYVNNMIGSVAPSSTLLATPAVGVINLINALPVSVTLADGAKIAEAREVYDGLPSSIRILVTNYEKLTVAEEALAQLKKEMADAVIGKINAIPDISNLALSDKAKVTAAREAYDLLQSDIKPMITNYKTLTMAEAMLANLEAINNAEAKSTTTVDVTDNPVGSKNIFNAIKGQDKKVTFTMEGITWTFNGLDIKDAVTADIDLSLKPVSSELKAKEAAKIKAAAGKDLPIFSFSFNYEGALPGKASVTIFLGTSWANKTVNICRYYEDKNSYETIDTVKVDENGYAVFTTDHCSDYFAVESTYTNSNGVVTQLPKTGAPFDMGILINFGMAIAGLGAIVIILDEKNRRKEIA